MIELSFMVIFSEWSMVGLELSVLMFSHLRFWARNQDQNL